MRQIECDFNLCFTTEDADNLPSPEQLRRDLEDLVTNAVDRYLKRKQVSGNADQLVLCEAIEITEISVFVGFQPIIER